MLPLATLSLVAFAAIAQGTPISHIARDAQAQDAISITQSDVDLLSLYSRYSAAAYCNNDTAAGQPIVCEADECERLNADKGIIVETFNTPQTDIAGYVAVVDSRKEIIFSVRGSVSDANWGVNLDFAPINSILVPGGWMHQGFYKAWVEIAGLVRLALFKAKIQHPSYKVILTGHSLGGAVATIAAAHLRAIDGYQLDLYTYGQPRIGNNIFADFVSRQPGRLFRVTHGNDPVPKVPLVVLDYRHTSPEIWLNGNATDPERWPINLIKTCYGNLNFACNSNLSLPINVFDHNNYFGQMTCSKEASNANDDDVYFPENIQEELEGETDADALLLNGKPKAGTAGSFL